MLMILKMVVKAFLTDRYFPDVILSNCDLEHSCDYIGMFLTIKHFHKLVIKIHVIFRRVSGIDCLNFKIDTYPDGS